MKQHSNNHYNKYLLTYAQENRQGMTKAEVCLWKYALSKKQMGITFYRQRPIEKYIVDFVCLSLKLIIEVDGYSHQVPENEEKDVLRQKALEELGFKFLRFKDSEVLNHIGMVRQLIYDRVQELG